MATASRTSNQLSVCLALIHNNNEKRNLVIRPNIEKLSCFLKSSCRVETFEIGYQPKLEPHPVGLTLKRDIIHQLLDREWSKYRQLPPPGIRQRWRHLKYLIKGYFNTYVLNRDNLRGRWQRSSAIETAVTDKHIRAWDRFAETNSDLLICFEDDAMFTADSIVKFSQVLHRISQHPIQGSLYATLGGGCSVPELRIGQLEESKDGFFTYYRKPVTNTSCAYLLNRNLVDGFKSVLIKKPACRLIRSDWMMNKLLIELEKTGSRCVCFHTDPPVFKHGSISGEFQSTIRD